MNKRRRYKAKRRRWIKLVTNMWLRGGSTNAMHEATRRILQRAGRL